MSCVKEQNLQLSVSIWKIIPTCYRRNKGEVENISELITSRTYIKLTMELCHVQRELSA